MIKFIASVLIHNHQFDVDVLGGGAVVDSLPGDGFPFNFKIVVKLGLIDKHNVAGVRGLVQQVCL